MVHWDRDHCWRTKMHWQWFWGIWRALCSARYYLRDLWWYALIWRSNRNIPISRVHLACFIKESCSVYLEIGERHYGIHTWIGRSLGDRIIAEFLFLYGILSWTTKDVSRYRRWLAGCGLGGFIGASAEAPFEKESVSFQHCYCQRSFLTSPLSQRWLFHRHIFAYWLCKMLAKQDEKEIYIAVVIRARASSVSRREACIVSDQHARALSASTLSLLNFSFAILIITKHKRYLDLMYVYIWLFLNIYKLN